MAIVQAPCSACNRELAMLRWGLVPSWAEDPKIGYTTINARAETVATKPAQTAGEITCSVRARGPFSRSLK